MKHAWQVLLVGCLLAATASAAENPFAGKWNMNLSKSTIVDEMKVASAIGNKYDFDLGGGSVETIAIDGTDQPGIYGTTLAVTAETPDKWKVVRKKDGRMMLTGIWTLSADGAVLSDDYTELDEKGAPAFHVLYRYQRTGGGSGFAGDWVSTSQPTEASEIEIETWEGDGLSMIRQGGATRHVKFDGKDYPIEGPNVPAGYVTSGKRVDARTVELTDRIGNQPRGTQQITVSEDGKVLTMTYQPAGRTRPNVMVFDRE